MLMTVANSIGNVAFEASLQNRHAKLRDIPNHRRDKDHAGYNKMPDKGALASA